MTSIDWYFSNCADCGYDFERILEVSTNTFGLTEEDATRHIEKFERSYAAYQAGPFLSPPAVDQSTSRTPVAQKTPSALTIMMWQKFSVPRFLSGSICWNRTPTRARAEYRKIKQD